MGWAKLDDKRHGNPKILALCADDPLRGMAASGLDAHAITYCAANETDGFVSDSAAVAVAPGVPARVFADLADRLVRHGRWARDDVRGGWQVHDYLDYHQTRTAAEARRAEERDRQAERRRRAGRDPTTGTFTPSARSTGVHQADSERTPGGVQEMSGRSTEKHLAATPPYPDPTRPDPTRSSSSVGLEPPADPKRPKPDDDDTNVRLQTLWAMLARRDLRKRVDEAGRVGDETGWLAAAATRRQAQLEAEVRQFLAADPTVSVEVLAEKLCPVDKKVAAPSSPRPAKFAAADDGPGPSDVGRGAMRAARDALDNNQTTNR